MAWERTPTMKTELLRMTSIWPELSGLPMTVWTTERGQRGRDHMRINVALTHGSLGLQRPEHLAEVVVSASPTMVRGELPAAELRLVCEWITLNRAVLLNHWEGELSADAMVRRLQPLPPLSSQAPEEGDRRPRWRIGKG